MVYKFSVSITINVLKIAIKAAPTPSNTASRVMLRLLHKAQVIFSIYSNEHMYNYSCIILYYTPLYFYLSIDICIIFKILFLWIL